MNLKRPLYRPSHERGPSHGRDVKDFVKRTLHRLPGQLPVGENFFPKPPGGFDDVYNEKTANAVETVQRWNDISATGNMGQETLNALWQYADAYSKWVYRLWKAPTPVPPVSNEDRVRREITDFCERGERAEWVWHYTQRRPFSGLGVPPEQTHYNDCSSYVVLAYFWAGLRTGLSVPDPSGYGYRGWGNTWDDLDGHPRVSGPYLVGDLAHYDGHVTVCRHAGDGSSSVWSSFGQENGPDRRSLHYRSDFRFVCRPLLLA